MKKLLLSVLLVMTSFAAHAVCTGSSTDVDPFYTNADTQHAIASLPNGYDWICETVTTGVKITFTFKDDITGMTAPYLFTFDAQGVLIGNPIPMSGWDPATRTATHILTGYTMGAKVNFLVQVACSEGRVIFSGRVQYTVGTDCTEEDATPVAACVDTLKTTDAYYSTANPAVDASLVLTNGYVYTCETMADHTVNIRAKFLDYLPGMAAPMLFLFHDVDGNEQLDGDPIQMEWNGSEASFTLFNMADGESIRFLVQIAYELHVLFCDRMTYIVGQNCQEKEIVDPEDPKEPEDPEEPQEPEDTGIEDIIAPQNTVKTLHNGQLIILRDNTIYNILGTRL